MDPFSIFSVRQEGCPLGNCGNCTLTTFLTFFVGEISGPCGLYWLWAVLPLGRGDMGQIKLFLSIHLFMEMFSLGLLRILKIAFAYGDCQSWCFLGGGKVGVEIPTQLFCWHITLICSICPHTFKLSIIFFKDTENYAFRSIHKASRMLKSYIQSNKRMSLKYFLFLLSPWSQMFL